jgi:hypothetical protein
LFRKGSSAFLRASSRATGRNCEDGDTEGESRTKDLGCFHDGFPIELFGRSKA